MANVAFAPVNQTASSVFLRETYSDVKQAPPTLGGGAVNANFRHVCEIITRKDLLSPILYILKLQKKNSMERK